MTRRATRKRATAAPVPRTKPYKALWALAIPIVVAVLTVILNGSPDVQIPPWAALAVSAVLSGLAVYQQTNPPLE